MSNLNARRIISIYYYCYYYYYYYYYYYEDYYCSAFFLDLPLNATCFEAVSLIGCLFYLYYAHFHCVGQYAESTFPPTDATAVTERSCALRAAQPPLHGSHRYVYLNANNGADKWPINNTCGSLKAPVTITEHLFVS